MSFTDDALVAAANLADRYIADRSLPDKAIDLIDEAGSRTRIRRMTAPPDVREVDEKIAEVRLRKESAIDAQDFEGAASLRDEERQLQEERQRREQRWKAGEMDVLSEIGEEEIAEVLSVWTGIPVFKLTEEETEKLLRMEEEIHKRIISQHESISAVSRAMRRTRSGLKDPRRPSGSFIFLGPSGVGKTELSKALAEFLFGDEDALIQLDMSEYMEKHGLPPDRLAPATSATRRADSSPRPFVASRSPWCCSTRSRSARGCLQHAAADPGGRASHGCTGP